MKREVSILLVSIMLCSFSKAQFTSFQKEYITEAFTLCMDIAPTGDGSYIISGTEDVPNTSIPTTPYITKIDCDGDVLWTKKFGLVSTLNNLDHKVAVLKDGNYLLMTSQGVTGSFDILLVKMDPDGNTIWAQMYGGFGDDVQGDLAILSDGNIGVSGFTKSYGANIGRVFSDLYAMKINEADGSIQWSATLGFAGAISRSYALEADDNGGMVVSGTAFHAPSVANWAPLIFIDANGIVTRTTFFGLPDRRTIATGLDRAEDGGYLISGTTNILGNDWFDDRAFPMVLKTDAQGNLEWASVIEGTPNQANLGGIAYSAIDNGETIGVSFETYFYPNQGIDPTKRVLAILNSQDGTLIQARQFNTDGGQFPVMKKDIDDGYIMSAFTDEFIGSSPGQQFWVGPIINKLDADFNSGCEETDRTALTILHQPTFVQDDDLQFDLVSSGHAIFPFDMAADSFAQRLPIERVLCEEELTLEIDILTSDPPCGQTIADLMYSGNYPLMNVQWDLGDGNVISDSVTISHDYENDGEYIVTVTGMWCDQIVSHTDTVHISTGLNDVEIIGPVNICIDSTLITFTSNYTGGVWGGTGIIDINNGSFSSQIAGQGQHFVTYEVDSNGCIGRDTLVVTVGEGPMIDLGKDTTICPQDTITLDAGNDYDMVMWSTGETSDMITVNTPGAYIVSVTKDGCESLDTIEVSLASLETVELGQDTTVCLGEVVRLGPVGDSGDVFWSTGETTNDILVNQEGQYSVAVTNVCGTIRDSVTLTFIQCGCEMYVPNAFTPNGDNFNDVMETFLPDDCRLQEYTVEIFNRWGELVFLSSSPDQLWNGTLNGERVPPGVYVYRIQYRTEGGNSTVRKGSVTLLY
jgi:gliding motility-associated-like protein